MLVCRRNYGADHRVLFGNSRQRALRNMRARVLQAERPAFRERSGRRRAKTPARVGHCLWRGGHTVFCAARTARMKLLTATGSFFPGFASTPLQTSTAYGLAERMASPTLAGDSPPARKIWPARLARRAIFQRKVLPLPPRLRRSKPSSKNALTLL